MRKLRAQLDLSQEQLAARCGVVGWDISRGTLAKVEAQVRCVTDGELAYLALALRVPLLSLYPDKLAQQLKKLGA